MKKVLFISFLSLFCCGLFFTSCTKKKKRLKVEVSSGPAQIGFEEVMYNLGDVKRSDRVSHVFVYYNLGSEPLIIQDVRTDCNCLQATFSKEPVKPGDSGELTLMVVGSGLEPGKFRRGAVVYSNAKNSPMNLMLEGYSEGFKVK